MDHRHQTNNRIMFIWQMWYFLPKSILPSLLTNQNERVAM